MSREYICLVLLSKKLRFWWFLVNKCGKAAVLVPFLYIPGVLEGFFDFFDSVHHHPLAGDSPAISRHTK
jgi:hypothetical protein